MYNFVKNKGGFNRNMGIFDIFSKRNKKSNTSIFNYEDFPKSFRVQVIHIWRDSLGDPQYNSDSRVLWQVIHDSLSREYGVFNLSERGNDPFGKCQYFLQEEKSTEKILDIIEFSFRMIDRLVREYQYKGKQMDIKQKPDEAIEELNYRFQEHGIGYQYISGQIVRVDSNYIFKEAVEPAVQLLFQEGFEGASEEYLKAHEHFRKGNDKEAVTEALKAFESVMKTICKRMKWKVDEKATAAPLIKALFENELLPISLQNQLTSVRASLEGLATVRNKNTGHGQGENSIKIPRHLVAYSLHLCATNIVFLIDSYKAIKK
jgi:hypothetical protein